MGYYYSKEDLKKLNKLSPNQLQRYLLPQDMPAFNKSANWKWWHNPKPGYDFYFADDLFNNMMLAVGIVSGITCMVVGGIFLPPLVVGFMAFYIGLFGGMLGGMLVGATLGWVAKKIYDAIYTDKEPPRELEFATPMKPLVTHSLRSDAKKSVELDLARQVKIESVPQTSKPSKSFKLYDYLLSRKSPTHISKSSSSQASSLKQSENTGRGPKK